MYKDNNIRKIREEKNITAKQIANYLGITMQAVAQYEKGLRNPSLITLAKISEYLNTPINELVGEQLTNTQIFLRETLKDTNLSIEELAKKINVPQSELKALYNNEIGVTRVTFFKFLNSIGIKDPKRVTEIATSDMEINMLFNNKITSYFFDDTSDIVEEIIKDENNLDKLKKSLIQIKINKTLNKESKKNILEIDVTDLSKEEIEDIKKYIEFIKFKKGSCTCNSI